MADAGAGAANSGICGSRFDPNPVLRSVLMRQALWGPVTGQGRRHMRETPSRSRCIAGDQLDPHGYGVTKWCALKRHHLCEHRIGGRRERGEPFPECRVTMPHESGKGGGFYPPGGPKVVSPSHVYRCPCSCHASGQLALEVTA